MIGVGAGVGANVGAAVGANVGVSVGPGVGAGVGEGVVKSSISRWAADSALPAVFAAYTSKCVKFPISVPLAILT